MNIKQLIKECYEEAIIRGDYDCPSCEGDPYETIQCGCNATGIDPNKNINELIALINLELYKALDCYVSDRFAKADFTKLCYKGLCRDQFQKTIYRCRIDNTYESYLASTFIKIFELCGYLQIDLKLIKDRYFNEGWLSVLAGLDIIGVRITLEEFTRAVSLLYGFCQYHKIDIEAHVKLKIQYNREIK